MNETTELETLRRKIERRDNEIARRDMAITHPTYSINRYDDEGDSWDDGIFIHFGSITIKVGEDIEALDTMIEQLGRCRDQIKEYYEDN